MIIRKAYKYRLKTNADLEQALRQQAGCVRWVWNQVWRMNQRRLAAGQRLLWYNEACFWLKLWKQSIEYGFLRDAHSQPLQQALKDLDRAYREGFDRTQPLKRLPTPKRRGVDTAFRYPQGVRVDNRRVYLPKLGWVGFFKSRPVKGVIKNATVSHQGGHWYVSLQVEQVVAQPAHAATTDVGIDLGVACFAALSTGETLSAPHPWEWYVQARKRAQRALARKVRFSANWRRQRARVTRLNQKIASCRRDFLHKTSTEISKNHAVVFVEDLRVGQMTRSARGSCAAPGRNVRAKAGLNRAILDQGWGEFRRQLGYKLAWGGGVLVAVPAHHTSQCCRICGHTDPANRPTQALFRCVACGHTEHADVHAAKNIRARGHRVLACGGAALATPPKQEPVAGREAHHPWTNTAQGIPVL